MLIALLYQIFIFTFCLTAGYFTNAAFLGYTASRNKPWILHLFTGIIGTTFLSQWLVLWIPIQLSTTLPCGVTLLLLLFVYRKHAIPFFKDLKTSMSHGSAAEWISYTALLLLVLVYTAGPTSMDDTESYHIQMIKWINEYGTVKGIAVLHERFGFNSSWFIAIAGFVPGKGSFQLYNVLNGTVSIALGYYLLSETFRAKKEQNHAYFLTTAALLFLSLVCWPIIRGNAGNSNYDMITAALLVVLLLESFRHRNALMKQLSLEWILWPVFLFTVRIINYPVLILSLTMFIWLLGAKNYRQAGALLFFSILLVAPFIARTVYVSGYPFYPLMAIDPFSVDWKPDPAIVQERIDFTKYFNRVNVMYMDLEETRKLPFPDWIYYWFRYLFRYDLPWVILGISGILLFVTRFRYSIRHWGNGLYIFSLVFLLQLISWFIISPDPRFIYGTLIGGTFFLCYALFSVVKLPRMIPLPVFAMIMSTGLVLYCVTLWIRKENLRNPIQPIALTAPTFKTVQVDGVMFHLPEKVNGHWNTRCFGTPLPCLYIMDPRIHLRGKEIKDGFRLE